MLSDRDTTSLLSEGVSIQGKLSVQLSMTCFSSLMSLLISNWGLKSLNLGFGFQGPVPVCNTRRLPTKNTSRGIYLPTSGTSDSTLYMVLRVT